MAISSLPSCASRRLLRHAGCVAFVPSLSSPGPSSSSSSSVSLLSFPPLHSSAGFLALRAVTGAQGDKVGSSLGAPHDPALLRRPLVSPPTDGEEEEGDDGEQEASPSGEAENSDGDEDGEGGRPSVEVRRAYSSRRRDDWMDWEDKILEDTVPLVSFVRMLIHSGKYESGDRLSPEHEKAIMERLLPYHPDFEKKIGCGIDFITVGYHPEFENSRCLFIVRKDGELVDFSYWKCIKGLIRKEYPLYADSFLLRHFRRRRQNNE